MAGGIIQLLANGAESLYLVGNPEFSYFKLVIKRHTNFSMESIRIPFTTKPVLNYDSSTQYTCRIGRNADLLKEIYIGFELPDIYSDGELRFQWIEKLAQYMILKYSIRIDSQVIDEGYGEWMDIWNELTLPAGKKAAYDKMTGNVDDYTHPRASANIVIVDNQEFEYAYYPAGEPGKPSIRRRRFYVPLPTWFSRSPALCLPLIALQYQQIDIVVEFRPLNQLYQVFDKSEGRYVSPMRYMGAHAGEDNERDVRFNQFLGSTGLPNTLDLDAYMEVNYIFLGDDERKLVALSSTDYLIERVARVEYNGLIANHILDMKLSHPIKEMIWVTRRSDAALYNEWTNLTNTIPSYSGARILKTAKFTINGLDRFDDKDAAYFNLIQPYQHHTNSPREGVYVYSYALYPERSNPSGHMNASMISNLQMVLTMEPRILEANKPEYTYELVMYALHQNIFSLMSGIGSIKFSG